ncbi:calcium-binding protein [Shimia thalassica]|nr:calcium-binding protein [Shimia thalassica]
MGTLTGWNAIPAFLDRYDSHSISGSDYDQFWEGETYIFEKTFRSGRGEVFQRARLEIEGEALLAGETGGVTGAIQTIRFFGSGDTPMAIATGLELDADPLGFLMLWASRSDDAVIEQATAYFSFQIDRFVETVDDYSWLYLDDSFNPSEVILGGADHVVFLKTPPSEGINTLDAGSGYDELRIGDAGGYGRPSFAMTSGTVIDVSDGSVAFMGGAVNLVSIEAVTVFGAGVTLIGHDAVDDVLRITGTNNDYTVAERTNTIHGLGGNDELFGQSREDRLHGGEGNDTLWGANGRDTLTGGDGDDLIFGGSGDQWSLFDLQDIVYAGAGNDTVNGEYGNDSLRGDSGDDLLIGGIRGSDTLIGGTGQDTLNGGSYADVLFGGDGADFLNGGFGFDRLNGGAGSDRFYHAGVRGHGTDWIQDYQASENDVLVFAGDADAADFHLAISTTPGAGSDTVAEVFVTHVPTLQILWALVDGAAQDTLVIRTDQGNFDLPL